MATIKDKPNSAGKGLKQDVLVDKLRPEPNNSPTEVITHVGFLGKSHRENYWRLYLSPRLNDYLEVAEEDIVFSQSFGNEQNSMGGTMLLIKREAKVEQTRTTSAQMQAEFLQGDIIKNFLESAGQGGTGGPIEPQTTTFCLGVTLTIIVFTIGHCIIDINKMKIHFHPTLSGICNPPTSLFHGCQVPTFICKETNL